MLSYIKFLLLLEKNPCPRLRVNPVFGGIASGGIHATYKHRCLQPVIYIHM